MRPRIAYQPGTSILHRLHPLVKAAWLIGATAALFAVHSPWIVLAVLGSLLTASILAHLPIGRVRGVRGFVRTAVLLGVLQIAFLRQGRVLVEAGPMAVTDAGIKAGIYVAGRFLSVVLLSYVYVLSTDPNGLAYALMQAGLPYRFGFALITALRLVPIFEQEGRIVYRAQLARGVRHDVRSPKRLLALARQFIMPLLVSALSKVDALAVSMEGRCFAKYPTRTFLREVHFERRDLAATALLVATLALLAMAGMIR